MVSLCRLASGEGENHTECDGHNGNGRRPTTNALSNRVLVHWILLRSSACSLLACRSGIMTRPVLSWELARRHKHWANRQPKRMQKNSLSLDYFHNWAPQFCQSNTETSLRLSPFSPIRKFTSFSQPIYLTGAPHEAKQQVPNHSQYQYCYWIIITIITRSSKFCFPRGTQLQLPAGIAKKSM